MVKKSAQTPPKDPVNLALGEFVQKRRLEMGFASQDALARQLQLIGASYSRGGVASLESGDVDLPGRAVFRGLCRVLEISPARFLQIAGYLDEPEAGELARLEEIRFGVRRIQEAVREVVEAVSVPVDDSG